MATGHEDNFKHQILDCLLELAMFTEGMVPRVNSLNFETTKTRIREVLPWISDIDFVRAGSVADQLFLTKIQNKGIYFNTDLDFIFVPKQFVVVWSYEIYPIPSGAIAFAKETTDPMYVKLTPITNRGKNTFPDSLLQNVEGSEELFISSKQFLREFQKRINHEHMASDITGPSQQILNENIIQSEPTNISSIDLVFALKMSEWPHQGIKWKGRVRLNKWPDVQTVKDISELDIHVVAKGNIKSENHDLEWRLSFNLAERKLAEILTQKEKQCLLIAKTLLKETGVENGISSYHLKTILWWMLEKGPLSRENWMHHSLAECLIFYLKEICIALKKHAIANYFVPDHNMILHIDVLAIQKTFDKFSKIVEEPIKNILSSSRLMENPKYLFSLSPLDGYDFADLEEMIDRDYETKNDARLREFFVYHFFNVTVGLLIPNPNQRQKVIALLKKIAFLKRITDSPDEFVAKQLVKYCFKCIDEERFTDACQAIVCLKEIEEVHDIKQILAKYEMEQDEIATLFHNTGCVFVRCSNLSFWEKKKQEDLQSAKIFFETAIELSNNVSNQAGYAHYLYTQESFKECLDHAMKAIEIDSGDSSLLSYDTNDVDVIDSSIARHVVAHNQMTVPAVLFAFYFFIRSLFELNRINEAIRRCSEMRILAEKSSQDNRYDSLSLAGYACLPLNLFDDAKQLFSLASKIRQTTLQKENIDLCVDLMTREKKEC